MSPASRPRAYVASPLGFTEAGRHWYAGVLLPALAEVVEPVDPWSLTSALEVVRADRAGPAARAALNATIGERNIAAIRSSSLLVAVLEGQELDSGTVAELGYAAGLGLPCFGLRTDQRQIGEPAARVNLQVEAFVRESGGTIAGSLDELLDALRRRRAG